jgi:hypothetical protein
LSYVEVSVKNPMRVLTVVGLFSLLGCAAGQAGVATPGPIGEDEIKLTVVNESDGLLDVFYIWENRSSRARLGSVSVGRTADFGVPFVTGLLRITCDSPISARTITSNALELSDANRDAELIVTVNWRFDALLEVKNQDLQS